MANETTVIQMFTTTVGDGGAVIDMPDDGLLMRAQLIISCNTLATDSDGFRGELSFASTSNHATNDARSVLCRAFMKGELVGTAATYLMTQETNNIDFADGIKVFGGERIYLHTAVLGSAIIDRAYAMLVFKFAKFTARRR